MEKMGDARGHSIIRKQETVATFVGPFFFWLFDSFPLSFHF